MSSSSSTPLALANKVFTKPKPKLARDPSVAGSDVESLASVGSSMTGGPKKASKAVKSASTGKAKKTSDKVAGAGTKKRKAQAAGLEEGPGTPGATPVARKMPQKTQPGGEDGSAGTTPTTGTTKKETKKAKKSEAKPKGPVDVERQCGVPLPQGGMCARSLTCKSHSMGSKRAVTGRSQPYDILLAQYQKKNHAKLSQKAAAEQAFQDVDDSALPVDSDEEVAAVMEAVARATQRSAQMKAFMPVRRRHKFLKMRELMSSALRPGQSGNLASHGKFIPFQCP